MGKIPGGRSITVKSPVLRVRPEVDGAGECANGGSIGLPHEVDG